MIYYMTEAFQFIPLSNLNIEDAISAIKQVDEDVGFVGCKGEHGREIYQWSEGDDWEPKVREMLQAKPSDEETP